LDGLTNTNFERLTFSRAAGGGVAVAAQQSACSRDAHGRATSRCSFRRPYDVVIACLGWRFARGMFDAEVLPALAANGIEVMVHRFAGEGHGFRSGEVQSLVLEATEAFFSRHFGL
jgi:hypothetical protein